MLMLICLFLLERDPQKCLSYLRQTKHNHPIVKLNATFLKVYMSCDAQTLVDAFRDYKCLEKLDGGSLMEAEEFIFQEYEGDKTKVQLQFLLFLLYNHRDETRLAKQALETLFQDERFSKDTKLSCILQPYREQYLLDVDSKDKKTA